MKKVLLLGLIALAVTGATCLPGCGRSRDASSLSEGSQGIPAGMVPLQGAGKMGDTIYNRAGQAVGTMQRYESQHRFPNGDLGPGLQVRMSDGVSRWMDYKVVSKGFFVKDSR